MLTWYFSNKLDIYDYVGKIPEQHFSVWLFSNQGDQILFLLKFNGARISEWNLNKLLMFLRRQLTVKVWKVLYIGQLSGRLQPVWELDNGGL